MGKYLITSNAAGTGKSTVAMALASRGYEVIEVDHHPELSRWENPLTGEIVPSPLHADAAWHQAYKYMWEPAAIQNLLGNDATTFVCGNAENAKDFYSKFDKIFILDIDSATLDTRLRERTDSFFAKDDYERKRQLDLNETSRKQHLVPNAMRVDARRSLTQLVNEILTHCDDL